VFGSGPVDSVVSISGSGRALRGNLPIWSERRAAADSGSSVQAAWESARLVWSLTSKVPYCKITSNVQYSVQVGIVEVVAATYLR
jgi:hypothetical protein